MKLSYDGLSDRAAWAKTGITLPEYNPKEIGEKTKSNPVWLHFGAGNIFRGFIAGIADSLISKGCLHSGISAAEAFDSEITDKIYKPFDNLVINVTLKSDGGTRMRVYGSIGEGLKAGDDTTRLNEIALSENLMLISFTVTEKGYVIHNMNGELLPSVKSDIENGPRSVTHVISIAASLLHTRFLAGGKPLALVSMDNCSNNGERLKSAILTVARGWLETGFADESFLAWLESESVSFPLSMIDKITPSPADKTVKMLAETGVLDMTGIITEKGTYIAPFVNAEEPGYLVIEDDFPNGRPPFEEACVYMTDKETVKKAERMKVTACLNPLHSAMAPFGCLLGYELISEQMKDEDIVALVRRIGYSEGLPTVGDLDIISPRAFLDEVINERLTNPNLPDSPWRIVTDHSQKIGIRFGETIKYYQYADMDLNSLTAISLAIAGWFRYLLAVNDNGEPFAPSADPLYAELKEKLIGITWNDPSSYNGQIFEILKNSAVFGQDLTKTPLAVNISRMFREMLSGKGAVRKTLHMYLGRT